MQKYKLTDKTIEVYGRTLHQIVCVTAFASVAAGEVGGYIEQESNLSQDGNAWVFGNARVYGDAEVYGNAWVSKNAEVFGNARVYGNAEVFGNAKVSGNAILRRGDIVSSTDYVVIGPQGSRYSFATFLVPSNTVCTGCFVGTLNDFKAKVSSEYNPDCCDSCKIYNEQYQRVIQVFEFYAKDREDKNAE